MSRTVKITSDEELLTFVERKDISKEDVSTALNVVVFDQDKSKQELIQDLKHYILKCSTTGYRGIFIGLPPLDVN